MPPSLEPFRGPPSPRSPTTMAVWEAKDSDQNPQPSRVTQLLSSTTATLQEPVIDVFLVIDGGFHRSFQAALGVSALLVDFLDWFFRCFNGECPGIRGLWRVSIPQISPSPSHHALSSTKDWPNKKQTSSHPL